LIETTFGEQYILKGFNELKDYQQEVNRSKRTNTVMGEFKVKNTNIKKSEAHSFGFFWL
jgi:hypothetical protein